MRLTLNGLLDRLAECIYDVVCYVSEHLEEDECLNIALRTDFNDKVTKIPVKFCKSRNDHYNTVLLTSDYVRQDIEVVCDPKNYCYKEITEWIRSAVTSATIIGLNVTDEIETILKNADGQICVCSLAGICNITLRNHKNYIGNEWLKRNYLYRGFTVDPDAPWNYCFECKNWNMEGDNGTDNLPVIPGTLPDDAGNKDSKYERFRVLKENIYENYNVTDE